MLAGLAMTGLGRIARGLAGARFTRFACVAALAFAAASPAASVSKGPSKSDYIIVNARIVDGTGAPIRNGAVRVLKGRIAAIGAVRPAPGEQVIDAAGLVLAPGFIDAHSHHDRGLEEQPGALAAVSQGITTIVVGQDGFSNGPLQQYFAGLARRPAAINIASYSGHNSLRGLAMGKDYRRQATPAEVRKMAQLLDADMRAGALGLSSGLEYDPGIYSNQQELVDLARISARYRGRYISHLRSEDQKLDAAVDEIVAIGRLARLPVQISHMKLALTDLWGQAGRVLARLDRARAQGIDITADVYPYEYWQSDLTVLFPKRDFTDLAAADFALTHLSTPDGMLISGYAADPSLVGLTIGQIAARRGKSPAQTYLDLINASPSKGTDDMVIGTSMRRDDVLAIMRWPHAVISSDGMLVDRHPRGSGAFTRALAWLLRGERPLSIEAAVAKVSGQTARQLGIGGRGTIRPGMAADLVLFDPATVTDRASIEHPRDVSIGIAKVWVNGVLVYADGKVSGATPGRVVRRAGS